MRAAQSRNHPPIPQARMIVPFYSDSGINPPPLYPMYPSLPLYPVNSIPPPSQAESGNAQRGAVPMSVQTTPSPYQWSRPQMVMSQQPSYPPSYYTTSIYNAPPSTPSMAQPPHTQQQQTLMPQVGPEMTGVLRRSRRAANSNSSSLFSKNLERTEDVNSFEKESNMDKQSKIAKTITALLLVPVIPALAIISTYSCTKESCKPGNFKIPWKSWEKVFDLEVSLWYIGFFLLQMILSLLPVAKPITGLPFTHKPQMSFRCNGLISAIITCGGIFLAKYLKCPITVLLDKIHYLLLPNFFIGLLVSFFIFFTTTSSRQKGSNFVNDFVFGRNVTPRLASLNFKIALLDFYTISVMSYIVILVIAEFERKSGGQLSYSFLASCFLHMVLLLDFLVFEADVVTSYFLQTETFGYFGVVGLMMWPFMTTLTPTYLFYTKGNDNIYILAGAWFLFCAGLLLYRLANHQKAVFRRKPNSFPPSTLVVTDREGRNLLASGLWGFVRHPNYLGCVLIYWSLVPLAWSHWAVYIAPVITTVEHLVRVQMVEAHSRESHSSAWSHYTSMVPYKLIPHVY